MPSIQNVCYFCKTKGIRLICGGWGAGKKTCVAATEFICNI